MSDNYYISSNCFYSNKKLYYTLEDAPNKHDTSNSNSFKNIKISNKTWCKYLKEYGWDKLLLNWRKKLNSRMFGFLECGSDGNCLFHVFAEGLNNYSIYNWVNSSSERFATRQSNILSLLSGWGGAFRLASLDPC